MSIFDELFGSSNKSRNPRVEERKNRLQQEREERLKKHKERIRLRKEADKLLKKQEEEAARKRQKDKEEREATENIRKQNLEYYRNKSKLQRDKDAALARTRREQESKAVLEQRMKLYKTQEEIRDSRLKAEEDAELAKKIADEQIEKDWQEWANRRSDLDFQNKRKLYYENLRKKARDSFWGLMNGFNLMSTIAASIADEDVAKYNTAVATDAAAKAWGFITNPYDSLFGDEKGKEEAYVQYGKAINMLGAFFGGATSAHASSIVGQISDSKQKMAEAEAFKQVESSKRDLDKYAKQYELALNTNDVGLANESVVNMNRVSSELEQYDELTKELADQYEVDKYDDDLNIFQKAHRSIIEWAGFTTAYNPEAYRLNLRDHKKREFRKDLSKHPNTYIQDADLYIKEQEEIQEELNVDYNNTLSWNDVFSNALPQTEAYKNAAARMAKAGVAPSLTDIDQLYLTLPSTAGSSSSSLSTLAATTIDLASVPVSTAGAAGKLGYGAMLLASSYLYYQGGTEENFAEAAEKQVENFYGYINRPENSAVGALLVQDLRKRAILFYRLQGMSEDWIKARFLAGEVGDRNAIMDYLAGNTLQESPLAREAAIESMRGIKAMREADNITTMSSEFVRWGVNAAGNPLLRATSAAGKWMFGKTLGKGVGLVKDTKLGKTVSKNFNSVISKETREGLKTSVSDYVNSIKNVYNRTENAGNIGGTLGSMTGIGYYGQVIGNAAGRAVKEGVRAAKDVLPETTKLHLDKIGSAVTHRYQVLLDTTPEFMKLLGKYGVGIGKHLAISSTTEGGEEGRQYLNAQKDWSKYGFGSASVAEYIINDIIQGSRVTEAYFSALGIGESELDDDVEFWTNVKGGMAAGWGTPGLSQFTSIYRGAKGGYRQYNVNNELANYAAQNRESKKYDRAAGREFVRLASEGKQQEAIEALKREKLYASRRKNQPISQEEYDELILEASQIMAFSASKDVRQKLEAKHIQYGSEEYVYAVADMYNLQKQLRQNEKESFENISKQQQGISKLFTPRTAESIKESELDESLIKEADEFADNVASKYQQEQKEAGIDITSPEFRKALNDHRLLQRQLFILQKLQKQDQQDQSILTHGLLLIAAKRILDKLNSVDKIFGHVRKTLGLKTRRPDAKLIYNLLKKRRDDAIQAIKGSLSEGFNIEDITDQDLIDSVSQETHGRQITEEMLELAENSLMLQADREVLENQHSVYQEGLIRDSKGKWQLNRKKYNAALNKARQIQELRQKGDIDGIQALREQKDEDFVPDKDEWVNDPALRRIAAIKLANEDNQRIGWALAELVSGDAVLKLLEVFDEEFEQQYQEELKAREKASKQPKTESSVNEPGAPQPQAKSKKFEENKRKREAAKAKKKELALKADEWKKKQKERSRNIKKSRKGKMYATLPFLPLLAHAAEDVMNWIFEEAVYGAYKIGEFYYDVKALSDNNNGTLDPSNEEHVGSIKQLYRRASRIILSGKDGDQYKDNLSTKEQIEQFNPDPEIQESVVESESTIGLILERMSKKIDYALSTYWDIIVEDESGTNIYSNNSALKFDDRMSNSDRLLNIVYKLEEIDDIEKFLSDNDISLDYAKLKGTEGFEELIARLIINKSNTSPYLLNAIQSNTWVSNILQGKTEGIPEVIVNGILLLKKGWENAGYKIEALNPFLFKEDDATQISVILSDESGNAHVVLVSSSYGNVMDMWDRPQYKNADFTKGEYIEGRLDGAKEILKANGIHVASTRIISITNDGPNKVAFNGEYVISEEKPKDDVDGSEEDISQLKSEAEALVQKINDIISEYNSYAEGVAGVKKYTPISILEYSTRQDYNGYIKHLQEMFNIINLDLKSLILKIEDEKDPSGLTETSEEDTSTETHKGASHLLKLLKEQTRIIDRLLNDIDNVDQELFIGAMVQAQITLSEILSNSEEDVDVTSEQSVIAAGIERILLDERFEKYNNFIYNWWATDLVSGIKNAPSQDDLSIDIVQMYRNCLANWIGTFTAHVINDIDNVHDLLVLYSTLLNKFLPTLIQNAETTLELYIESILDPYMKAIEERRYAVSTSDFEKITAPFSEYAKNKLKEKGVVTLVDIAKELIDEFNHQWGVEPDPSVDGPTEEAKKINQLPIKWRDLYGESNSIYPSEKAAVSINGKQIPAGLRNDVKFKEISYYSDFAQSTAFTLGTYRDGSVGIWYNYNGKHGHKYGFLAFSDNVKDLLYKGQTLELVKEARIKSRANKRFIQKIKLQLDFCKTHRGYLIDFTVRIYKGGMQYRYPVSNPLTDLVFAGENNQMDMYNAQVSADNNIGIVVYTYTSNGELKAIYTGETLKQELTRYDEEFAKKKSTTPSGTLVYMYNTGKDNFGNEKRIAVPIPTVSFAEISPNVVYKLVSLITKKANGETKTADGFDIDALLNLVLYTGDVTQMSPLKSTSSVVNIKDGKCTIDTSEYDVNDLRQKQALKSKISNMHIAINPRIANLYITDDSNPVFSKIHSLFTFGNVQEVHLPLGITIRKDDVSRPNKAGTTGCTWLGYLMRNGYIRTNAAKLKPKYISIVNPIIVKKQQIHQSPVIDTQQIDQKQEIKPVLEPQRRRTRGGGGIISESLKRLGIGGPVGPINNPSNSSLNYTGTDGELLNRSDEQLAEFTNSVYEFFDQVFGSHDDVIITDHLLEPIVGGRMVLGKCGTSFIALSQNAPESVAFHEAFHKILELMIPSDQREEFYNIYRSKFKGELSERDIAEGLCDMFTDWMTIKSDYSKMKGFLKIKGLFRKIAFNAGMVWKIGIPNYFKFMRFYGNITSGKYINTKPSKEAIERFENLFGESLHYEHKNLETGHVVDFEGAIYNSYEYKQLIEALGVLAIKAHSGSDINPSFEGFKIDSSTPDRINKLDGGDYLDRLRKDPAFEIVFRTGSRAKTRYNQVTKQRETISWREDGDTKSIMEEYYPNWNVIMKDVADYCAQIVSEYRQQDEIQDEDELVQRTNIDKYDRAAYEFSKLESTTQAVKQFFATMYNMLVDELTGEFEVDYGNNIFGSCTYIPTHEAFNRLVKDFHDATSIEDLLAKMQKLQDKSPIHKQAYQKYKQLVRGTETEKTVEILGQSTTVKQFVGGILKEDGTIDYDKEAFAIQILSCIRSQQIDFTIAYTTDVKGLKSTKIISSSTERDSASYPKQWTNFLLSGIIPVFDQSRKNGKLVFLSEDKSEIFNEVANFIESLIEQLSDGSTNYVEINGNTYDKTNPGSNKVLKAMFIDHLSRIGIMMSPEALDYMLQEKYGDISINSFKELLTQRGKESMSGLVNKLRLFKNDVYGDKQKEISEGYTKIGFVKELGLYQGKYRRLTVESTALGFDGKTLHTSSLNNSITHILQLLNTRNQNNDTVRILRGFGYNYATINNQHIGSIILKDLLKTGRPDIVAHTFLGSRTDHNNDSGIEYQKQSTVDDYIAKLSILQTGAMTFPTLADKGTWMYLTGVNIPGMTFEKASETSLSAIGAPTVVRDEVNYRYYLRPNDQVLNLMLEYALTERLAICQCMLDMGYKDIPGYKLDPSRKVLPKEARIKNYHTQNGVSPKDGKVETGGMRFLSLTEIWIPGEIKPINLNDPNKSSIEMLKLANEKFFDKPYEELLEILANTLSIQTEISVDRAMKLGVVHGSSKIDKVKSEHLNNAQIAAVKDALMRSYVTPSGQKAIDIVGEMRPKYEEMFTSLAISAIIADANNRSIISTMETQRCFSGHPALFKLKYDTLLGRIEDITADFQKRVGGMVSTGEDNFIEGIPGLTKTYTCAEIDDYEIGIDISEIREKLISSAVKEAFANSNQARGMFKNPWLAVYGDGTDKNPGLTVDQIKALDIATDIIKHAEKLANIYAYAYSKEINVADGASYITQEMCKNMLRMRGAFTQKVKEAFDLLESDKSISWTQEAEAYDTIYHAVNLVPTKYTAYGIRRHTLTTNANEDSQQMSDVAVVYYNKFALFPIFDCMATGKMKNIYKKMKDERVDMLFMNSAVKVGSQGSVKYKKIDEMLATPFNKYTQDITFLRRQLNTDPEEGDRIAAGTQMIKISFANLRTDRLNYKMPDGTIVSGSTVLQSMMNRINQLAVYGELLMREEFFKSGTSEVDPIKLSNFLKSQLTARDANKGLIEAILIEKDPITGEPKLACPLSATADASWIESFLISTIGKRIIDINLPGSSFIQRSVFAMENEDGEGSIQEMDAYNGQPLSMLNEDNSMDAIISIDYFENIIPKKYKSFSEKRQWLIDNSIIGKSSTALTIGYRIPTQAQSSIHPLRFIDVVPVTKSTVILPKEFTKITGSDFDIDHLYLVSYNHSVSKDGTVTIPRRNNVTNESSLLEKINATQNELLDYMMTLLKDEESANSLYKSIDNDTALIKDKADFIPETGSTKHHAFNVGCLHELVIRKNDYITGKIGIAPFALNATSHMLTCAFELKWKSTPFTEGTFMKHLHYITDTNGDYISSWLSGFINAHVDIVKDPYVSRINVNLFTYNMINLLVRSGQGEAGVWLLSQPVIREMAEASTKAESEYTRNASSESKSFRRKRLIHEVLESRGIDDNDDIMLPLRIPSTNDQYKTAIAIINKVFSEDFVKAMQYYATDNYPTQSYNGYSYYEVLSLAYYAFSILEQYSRALSTLVLFTKIDTKKHGKTLMETERYLDGYNKLTDPKSETSLFDTESMLRFVKDSWIDTKTRIAIEMPKQILGKTCFNANSHFVRSVFGILGLLHDYSENLENIDTINTIGKHAQTAIKSKFFVQYAKQYLGKTDDDLTELFLGKNTIADRLNKILYDAKYTDKYTEGSDNYRYLNDNLLLLSLYSSSERDDVIFESGHVVPSPKFIELSDNIDGSRLNEDLFIDAWEELLTDPHEDIRAFARDLIVYAMLTSGEFKGWTKMAKFIPPSWIRGEIDVNVNINIAGILCHSYKEYIEKVLQSGVYIKNLIGPLDDIVANNCLNPTIVPKVPMVTKDEKGNDVFNFVKDDTGQVLIHTQDVLTGLTPLYIMVKRKYASGKDVDSYNLYMRTGYFSTKDGQQHPVYIQIPKKGYRFKGYNIYEYGWSFNYPSNLMYSLSEDTTISKISKLFDRILLKDINLDYFELEIKSKNPEWDAKYGFKAWTDYLTAVYNNPSAYEEYFNQQYKQEETKKFSQYTSGYINHSGGARGADTLWDEIGRQYGVTEHRHYRDLNNPKITGNLAKANVAATILSKSEMDVARRKIKDLIGIWYDDNVSGNLRVRNYFLVANADAVYAIATLNESHNGVSGGTNTAIQLAIKLDKPIYVWDTTTESWYQYNTSSALFESTSTPTLTKNFAGIGTRDIENYNTLDSSGRWMPRKKIVNGQETEAYLGDNKRQAAIQAIKDVYENTAKLQSGGDSGPSARSYTAGQNPTKKSEARQKAEDIYSKLGDKTTSEHVVIAPGGWAGLSKMTSPVVTYGNGRAVVATRIKTGTTQDFGNTFTDRQEFSGSNKLEYVGSTKEAVIRFIQAVLESADPHYAWIRELIKSGDLKGLPILYWKELREPSHATALDYLINHPELFAKDKSQPSTPTSILNKNNGPVTLSITYTDGSVKDVKFDNVQAVINFYKPIYDNLGTWEQNKKFIMTLGAEAAFRLNDQTRMVLLATGDAKISTGDKLLDEVLTELRTKLQAEADEAAQEGSGTISSQYTILNEGEKKLWNYTGDMNAPRILVASEHTDPVLHAQEVIDTIEGRRKVKQFVPGRGFVELTGQDYAGAYMITKHDGLPLRKILECKKRTGIPLILHFSITGNGGTAWEPGVMRPDDLMNNIEKLINEGLLDPSIVTFRIDPIIPGHLDRDMVKHIISRGKAMGINKFRFSVMDAYEQISMPQYAPNAEGLMVDSRPDIMKNFDWDTYYGRDSDQKVNSYNEWKCQWAVNNKRCTAEQARQWKNEFYTTGKQNPDALKVGIKFKYSGNVKFEAKQEYIDEVMDFFEDIAANDPSIRIGTCAEHGNRAHIKQDGCLSVASVNSLLGTTIQDNGKQNNTYRKECSCYGGKSDILAYTNGCASSCTYCYARHNDKKPLRYYDENGTLKPNGLTVTSMQELKNRLNSKARTELYNADDDTENHNKPKQFQSFPQGSTYTNAIVDGNDIMSVGPISNRTKSESIYTALTRAKKTAIFAINGTSVETTAETARQDLVGLPNGSTKPIGESIFSNEQLKEGNEFNKNCKGN